MSNMNNEYDYYDEDDFEAAVEEATTEINDRISCAEESGVEPGIMMFRLMYPLAGMPTGRKCQIENCACGGENNEVVEICTAVN